MRQEMRLELAQHQESDEVTKQFILTRSDCLAAAHAYARVRQHEAEAYWLLMAASMAPNCDEVRYERETLPYRAPESLTAAERLMVERSTG